jgi:hypothetical protein
LLWATNERMQRKNPRRKPSRNQFVKIVLSVSMYGNYTGRSETRKPVKSSHEKKKNLRSFILAFL